MRRQVTTLALAATTLAVGLVVSSTAWAADGSPVDEETGQLVQEKEGDRAWSLGADLVSRVGQGTFADLENETGTPGTEAPNASAFDRALLIYVLSGSYEVGDFTFSPEFTWTHWLTQGGGLNGPGEFRFQDISLIANWSGTKIEPLDSNLSASLEFSFPTSDVSQAQSKIVGVDGTVSISHNLFDKVAVIGSVSGSKTFHRFKSPRVNIDDVGEDNVLFRNNEAEDLGDGLIAIGGLNTEYALSGSLTLSFPIVDKLRGTVSYGLAKYWTYKIDNDDQLNSEFADTGRGTQDLSSATVTLSYPINQYLSVSGGIVTRQPPKTSDNESFRFPFWNTQGAANNYSSLQLAVSATY